jgi:excinuclease UvrABC nuclease subunit
VKCPKLQKRKIFEYPLSLRNQIDSLMSLREWQNIGWHRSYEDDILNYIQHSSKVYVLLFNFYKSVLENKQEFEQNFLEKFLLSHLWIISFLKKYPRN